MFVPTAKLDAVSIVFALQNLELECTKGMYPKSLLAQGYILLETCDRLLFIVTTGLERKVLGIETFTLENRI